MTQMRCISCGSDAKAVKEWNYRNNFYQVIFLKCPCCSFTFKAYYHNGQLSHTIPRYPEPRKRVIKFLRENKPSSNVTIARKLRMDKEVVDELLFRLEKEGLVERTLKRNEQRNKKA